MSATKRANAGEAVAGLFAQAGATGGLAHRIPVPRPTPEVTRVRVGVELTNKHNDYLRNLSRPDRTGQPRTLGTKFVATGVIAAAIKLLQDVDVDMNGVEAGDLAAMIDRALDALTRAAATRAGRSDG